MLERLLEFLLHAKAGAISGVLLIGAGGALVSATTQNGVTTITIQEASPTPTATASPTPSPTPSPTASPTASPSASPEPSSSPSSAAKPKDACDDEAHERNEARKTVHEAFVKFHGELEKLRNGSNGRGSEKARDMLKSADKLLHEIDEAAKDAIHDATRCERDDDAATDEDSDEEADEDETPVSEDVDALVEDALGAMDTVFELAKSRLEDLNAAQPAVVTKPAKPEFKKEHAKSEPKSKAGSHSEDSTEGD